MNKKYVKIIFIGLFAIALYLFSQLYMELYHSSSKESQTLYFAIGLAMMGITAHFLKKHPSVKDKKGQELGWDTIELLMIIATPVVVSFDNLREAFPNNPDPILVVSALAFGSWYTVSIIRAGRLDQNESKQTFFTAYLLFGIFLFVIGLAVLTIILYK